MIRARRCVLAAVCATIALGAGSASAATPVLSLPVDATVLSAVVTPRKSSVDEYRHLLPPPYKATRHPLVGISLARLGPSYVEGSIALRARAGKTVGWFPLSQPVNNQGQFVSGRLVGLPKELVEATVVREGKTWVGRVSASGKRVQKMWWRRSTRRLHEPSGLRRWTTFRDPLLTVVPPLTGPAPLVVRFTPSPLDPAKPLPAPRLGRVRVHLPGARKRWHGVIPDVVSGPGMLWRANGRLDVFISRLGQ